MTVPADPMDRAAERITDASPVEIVTMPTKRKMAPRRPAKEGS